MFDLALRKTEYAFSPAFDFLRYRILPYRNNRFPLGHAVFRDFSGYARRSLGMESLSGATILEIGSGNTVIQGALFRLREEIGKYIYSEPFMYFPVEKNIRIAREELIREGIDAASCFTGEATLDPVRFEFNRDLVTDLAGIPSGSVDLIISNAVFEHIRAEDLPRATEEMHRVLRPGGGMIHQVDLRDHGYYFRRNYAFLRYSFAEWRALSEAADYSVFWANRLRCSDFERAFAERFRIVESVRQKYSREELDTGRVHPELLERYSREELETEGLLITCVK